MESATVKYARSLRTIKNEETDSDDLSSQEERLAIKSAKVDKSYLKHPLLVPEAKAVAAAKKADEMLAKRISLNKVDNALMQKLKANPAANARITRWIKGGLKPDDVATLFKKYPTLRRDGPEWTALNLYQAIFLRQTKSLNPTVKLK
ncbi:Avirulence (Avh) protein [Phytophthora megakarya]|uniref:Avirulence (Avh) protein n=1 Tax=Phytophthora megakarya TaxID=4795 RepID=A0A225VN62_9STRA|nr:Avirulence (Avh) protein [Phytophthora megakarya]